MLGHKFHALTQLDLDQYCFFYLLLLLPIFFFIYIIKLIKF